MCCHWIDEFCRSYCSPTPSIYIDSGTDLKPDTSTSESVLPQCVLFVEFHVPFVSCSSFCGVQSALLAVFWNLEFYVHFSHQRAVVYASLVSFCKTFLSNTSFSFGICSVIHCCVVLNYFSLVHSFATFADWFNQAQMKSRDWGWI